MKEILDKISSYNIFNYLLPGAIMGVWLSRNYGLDLGNSDILTNAFVYYFLGLIVSRFGSLVIEPILKKIKLVKFEPHSKYVKATQKDDLIMTLVETSNMYRTFVSFFVLLGLVELAHQLKDIAFFQNLGIGILILLLVLLFAFSYKKQTGYINKRINTTLDE